MLIDLTGKTALVTASTSGIGHAIAHGLAAAGAHLILNGRSQASVDAARRKLLQALPQARIDGLPADVADAGQTQALLQALPPVDILVNNAGIYGPQDFFDTDDAQWDHYWHTNVMSGVRLSRALLPGMVERGWGRVVFISSESARNIPADMIHYGVSKTAQLALSRGLAKRVAGSGVTVNSVLPGPTLSEGAVTMLQGQPGAAGQSVEALGRAFVMQHRASSVIQRMATMDEVASMVVYLCSTQASATSGAALRVDGGVVDDIT